MPTMKIRFIGDGRVMRTIDQGSTSLSLTLLVLMISCLGGVDGFFFGSYPDVCGKFLLFFNKYTVCRDFETPFTLFPFFDPCGECPPQTSESPFESPFEEVEWTPSCDSDNYDFYSSLYFCRDGNIHGYRTSPGGSCNRDLAPTIRMQAGKRYQMRLFNEGNARTNLHTHGLRIPGSGNTDDITREAQPGECLFYNWTIPSDHMDGTLWYHAHAHPTTERQVDGGAVGILVVDPADDAPARPDWIEATENDRFLLFLTQNGNGNQEYINGDAGTHNLVLDPNRWHRLRMVFADSEARLREVQFDSDNCRVHHVATDGVWRNTVPKPGGPEFQFQVTGATRLDVAIRCSSNSEIRYKGETRVRILMSEIDGVDANTALPSWTPTRPDYLTSLEDAGAPDDTFSIAMDVRSGINGVMYNDMVPLRSFVHAQLQEWTLLTTNSHPFHLHMYHMQIISNNGCGGIFEENEWVDTIAADTNGPCVVRFRTDDIGGRTTMHCHILSHEDAGVMAWVDVDNAPTNGEIHIESQDCASECYAI